MFSPRRLAYSPRFLINPWVRARLSSCATYSPQCVRVHSAGCVNTLGFGETHYFAAFASWSWCFVGLLASLLHSCVDMRTGVAR